MSRFLVDTNVVSELTKRPPDELVVAFLTEQDDLWLSTIVLYELEFGVNLLPRGPRRNRIAATLSRFVAEYEDRILPVNRQVAEEAVKLREQSHRSGRDLRLGDALIAGTATAHNLTVATRNIKDFQGLDIDIINPWESE